MQHFSEIDIFLPHRTFKFSSRINVFVQYISRITSYTKIVRHIVCSTFKTENAFIDKIQGTKTIFVNFIKLFFSLFLGGTTRSRTI